MSPSGGRGPRIVILGWDGAPWDLLEPWLAAGELPTLARIMREGAWGPLRSVYPPGTGPAWSSIATGVNPARHGIYEFMRRREGSYLLGPVDSADLLRHTIWDVVASEGGRSLLLNVPMTWPPREVRGLMVTGILTPPGSRNTTWPPEFAAEIESRVPGYKVLPESVYRPGEARAFLAELEEVAERKSRLMLDLASRGDWRLLFEVWNETDIAQHAFWHLEDRAHPHHDPAETREAPEALLRIYRRLDAAAARLLDLLHGDAVVAVVSDHGAGALRRLVHANNWLLAERLLAVRGNAVSRAKRWAFGRGFTPMNVYLAANRLGLGAVKSRVRWSRAGYELMRRGFFSFADVDWKRTIAFGIGGGVTGGVFLNVRGREPEGAVEPGAAYERVREEVRASLLRMPDPATGAPVIGEVLRREEVYAGPFIDRAPDLVMVPADPAVGIFGDFEFSSHRLFQDAPRGLSGHHRMHGIAALWGPGIAPGRALDAARLEDITPTLLHLAGIAPSADMDGRLLVEAFDPAWSVAHPERRIERPAMRAPGEGARGGTFSPEEEAGIRERLRSMGYMS